MDAKRWSDETPKNKKLPEKVMEKEAMFFEDQEAVEDGMFMKRAADLQPPKAMKPVDPNKTPKAEDQVVHPGEVMKGTSSDLMNKKPSPTASSMMGIPKKAASVEDIAGRAKNIGERGVGRLGQTASALGRGTMKTLEKAPENIEKALKYVENMSPEAQAALVGGGAYIGGKKIMKGVAKATGRVAPSKMQKLLRGLRRLRGR
jgi:hypothetical protein